MIDGVLTVIDHIAARVTASAAAGIGCGAAYATYKGFPIFKTSMSAALSCALVSTACFAMERVAHGVLTQSAMLIDEKLPTDGDSSSSSNTPTIINQPLHYGSHALGGLLGGSVVGFLFQGKPLAGALFLTPIMLGIGRIEVSLDEYRTERLQKLLDDHDDAQEEQRSVDYRGQEK